MAGLVLGVGGAFAAQTLDPRLRREEQLRALYRLPVLARIPEENRGRSANVVAPHQLSPAGVEAFRTLRATLSAPRGRETGRARAVMITGAGPAEGKTTTALNLAASFALAGKRVILIEADLRRPKIGGALRVRATRGIASVLIDGLPLSEALLTTEAYGENLKLLLVDRAGRVDGGPVLAARRAGPGRGGEGDGRHRDHRLAAADRGDRRAAARADDRRRGRSSCASAARTSTSSRASASCSASTTSGPRASRWSASARPRSTATTRSGLCGCRKSRGAANRAHPLAARDGHAARTAGRRPARGAPAPCGGTAARARPARLRPGTWLSWCSRS